MNIGFNKKNKHYYLWDTKEKVNCNVCSKIINNQFILNTIYNDVFKITEQRPYCINCFELVKRKLDGCMSLVLIEKSENLIPVLPDTLVSKGNGNLAYGLGGVVMSDKDINNDLCNSDLQLEIKGKGIAFNSERNVQKLNASVSSGLVGFDWANAKRKKKEDHRK